MSDKEDNKIKMKFKGLEKFKCKCVRVEQVGSQFNLKVEKNKLKKEDVGVHKIIVDL